MGYRTWYVWVRSGLGRCARARGSDGCFEPFVLMPDKFPPRWRESHVASASAYGQRIGSRIRTNASQEAVWTQRLCFAVSHALLVSSAAVRRGCYCRPTGFTGVGSARLDRVRSLHHAKGPPASEHSLTDEPECREQIDVLSHELLMIG